MTIGTGNKSNLPVSLYPFIIPLRRKLFPHLDMSGLLDFRGAASHNAGADDHNFPIQPLAETFHQNSAARSKACGIRSATDADKAGGIQNEELVGSGDASHYDAIDFNRTSNLGFFPQ